MAKFFTTRNEQWDESRQSYAIPEQCLACTIKNDGDSLVLIDEVIKLIPGQAYQIPSIAGYFLKGNIRVKVIQKTAPYSTFSKVTFRNAVEVK